MRVWYYCSIPASGALFIQRHGALYNVFAEISFQIKRHIHLYVPKEGPGVAIRVRSVITTRVKYAFSLSSIPLLDNPQVAHPFPP